MSNAKSGYFRTFLVFSVQNKLVCFCPLFSGLVVCLSLKLIAYCLSSSFCGSWWEWYLREVTWTLFYVFSKEFLDSLLALHFLCLLALELPLILQVQLDYWTNWWDVPWCQSLLHSLRTLRYHFRWFFWSCWRSLQGQGCWFRVWRPT